MDANPLIPRVYIALLSIVLLGASAGAKASAKEVPKIPTQDQTATAAPLPTDTPSPTASPSPTPTITQTPTPATIEVLPLWSLITITPTPGRWKRYLPCENSYLDIYRELDYLDEVEAESYLEVLAERARWWATWIEYWGKKGTHKIPMEIGLAIMMHESRGDPTVVSCSNAIGLFGIIPNDAILEPPIGCAEYRPLTFADNPSTHYLSQSRNNIRFGLDHLEAYTWEGWAYVEGMDKPPYRDMIYDIMPEASDVSWWYSPAGKATIAMYQCGPSSFRTGACGKYGGTMYTDDVLGCWVPWVRDIMDIGELITMGGEAQ